MKNVFENTPDYIPVKFEGKIVGEGRINEEGFIEVTVTDEETKKKLSDTNESYSISANPFSHTIELIQENRKRKGLPPINKENNNG